MGTKRKYSVFIGSTYEDLKAERLALMKVALESNYIPVGMELFHAVPAEQWEVITKMIDDCDVYMLIIAGRYGTIDDKEGISYTEKEYNYAKSKGIPVLAFIKNDRGITMSDVDKDDSTLKIDLLKKFKERVKREGNTVDFFNNIDELKYAVSASLNKGTEYLKEDAGWIRYSDIDSFMTEKITDRNKDNKETIKKQTELLEGMKRILVQFSDRLKEIENGQFGWTEIPNVSREEVEKWLEESNE